MEVVSQVQQLRDIARKSRASGRRIGFVPTMGALHAGHRSLIDAAKRDCDFTAVSIYVNPTQFAPGEDFERYPRPVEADRALCRAAGVDLIFEPLHEEIYPPGPQLRILPGPLADHLCGPFRPGHFEGVCTVVAKLFNIVQPDVAFFGQKDAQQAVIIRRMVTDFRMPIQIEVCSTVREPDGLAMSSRNAYLSPGERERALCLYRALCTARERLLAGEPSCGRIIAAMCALIDKVGNARVDYLSIVDPETLVDLAEPRTRMLVAGAVRLGRTRLIDNLLVELPTRTG